MIEINNLNLYFIEDVEPLEKIFTNFLYSKIFILVDKNTKKYCLPKIQKYFNKFYLIEINEGEDNKNINTCNNIWNTLLNNNADRKSLLINLGGGLITDIGAFCAATYKRGIDFINIPTTLLSQVDASIGGKSGINFNNIKNSIGLFINPNYVFVIKEFLNTINKREYNSGFSEMIKHSIIKSKDSFDNLINSYDNLSIEDIYNSANIKYSIVKEDFNESGIRKILNIGHTIGHSLETISIKNNNRLLHGEAVAIGLICELYISNRVLDTNINLVKYISNKIISLFGYFNISNYSTNDILNIIKNDKKNSDNKKKFSLIKDFGDILYDMEVSDDIILNSIEFYNNIIKS